MRPQQVQMQWTKGLSPGHLSMAGLVCVFSLLRGFSMAVAISLVRADQNPPAIFAFGDSLSDVGNNNDMHDAYHANFPHYGVDFPDGVSTGRFTNGYNFIDIIARQMGFEQSPPAYASLTKGEDVLQGVNFASGGSGILLDCVDGTAKKCITMEEQIENFKLVKVLLEIVLGSDASSELISKSIFIFTCGGNDINNFFLTNFPIPVPSIFNDYVANMTSTFRELLKEIYNLGGRKFSIVNVPALGKTPPVVVLHFSQIILNLYARKFNSAEEKMLKELSSTLPGMKYSIENAYAAITDVVDEPKKHGMKNVVSPCCGRVDFVLCACFLV